MSKSLQEIADSIILMDEDERQLLMKEKPTKVMAFGHDMCLCFKLLNRVALLERENQLADEIIAIHKEERQQP